MSISVKVSFLSLVLVVYLAGSAGAQHYPVGDLNEDYKVNFRDLRLLSDSWLDASCVAPACEEDLDGVPGVDMSDFAWLAGNWLKDYSEITLVINEFMALNNSDSGIRDEHGDYDDWIEIYNYGHDPVNIGGLYIIDDISKPAYDRWMVATNNPTVTTISAGGFLIIWADGETSEGTLHASFKLSGSDTDEDICLFDEDRSNIIDAIFNFNDPAPQEQNKSYGRLPDGGDNWQIFDNSTPRKSNEVPPPSIIISEIMYHPYHNSLVYEPENLGEEYIELFNRGTESINFSGWQFSDGVEFAFPNDVTIGAGQYLVVAADVNTFTAKYPGVNNIVGGWTGKLSNKGEEIEIADENGMIIDRFEYADEGDWAVRELGPLDNRHRGWVWSNEHDGGGKSMELINPALPNKYGQNWAASNVNDGTPGVTNSVTDGDIAPLVLDVKYSPIIPGPNDPVTVTARIIDELSTGITVTLHYRVDASEYLGEDIYPSHNPSDYSDSTMFDDGAHGDGETGDGVFGVELPTQPDGTIVEFYIEASDAGANSRTWPAPSDMSSIGTGIQQVTNLLYQVDDTYGPNAEWSAESDPIFYLIMTETERGRLADIGNEQSGDNGERHSRAQMNGTFISIDGVDMKKRYAVSFRNRGESNSGVPPNNYRVNFRHDDPWKGITAININSKYTYLQVASSVIFCKAGLLAAETSPVEVRVNGTNLALTDPSRMYGAYAYLEVFDGDWAENHIPDDDSGNIYKASHYPWTANLTYRGTDPADYDAAGYYKLTNESENDWTDLFDLTNVLDNEPDVTYVEEVNRVLNAKQWLRWFAANAITGNNETGLGTGVGDDYRMYRGLIDTRFQLLIHDLDTILYVGPDIPSTSRSIFYVADRGGLPVIDRFIKHPVFVREYYAQLMDLTKTVFAPEQYDPLIDQLLGDWVPLSMVNEIKQKMAERITYVLQEIPQDFSIDTSLPQSYGYYKTTNPSVDIGGEIDAIRTRSILVNGVPAAHSPFEGTWSTGMGLPGELLLYLPMDTIWSYEQSNTDLGTAWRAPDYDDLLWSTGRALLYVEGSALPGPKNTLLNIGANTYYFRTEFYFDGDPNEVALIQVYTVLDDGAVIYLNGHNGDDARHIGVDTGPLSHADYANRSIGNATREGPFTIPTAHLVHGDNVIAVEVHQITSGSSDIVWGMELQAYSAATGGDVALQPGINRIIVQTFDEPGGTGNELESKYIDIWYDDGDESTGSGTIYSNTTWDAASGPWHVTGDITIPAGVTLTIEPGTTLFFNSGTGITINTGGRLLAEGTEYERIRLTRVPGGANWDGVKFVHTLQDNRLCYIDHEFGDGQGMSTDVQHSRVLIDNMTWGGTNTMALNIDHPSVICRNSVFPSIGNSELLHGVGLSGKEYIIFDGCIFGTATGYNDIIDFTGAQRPGPIFQVYNSIFLGGGDDGPDLDSTDAHIEGNIFMNFHLGGTGTSNAIATGEDLGWSSEIYVARNIFINNDHAVLLKEDCFMHAQNNVFVNTDIAVVSFGEPYRNPPREPGGGVDMEGNIFWNNTEIFEHFFQEPNPTYGPTGDVIVNRSILPSQWHYLGLDNIDADPIFVDPNSDFHLKPMSPAIGLGACGLDMGAIVPAGAAISGEPDGTTYRTYATLTVGGPGITDYNHCVNDPNGPWLGEFSVDIPIVLNGLADGQYTVYVIGKNSAGVWQTEDEARASRTWTVDTSYSQLIINEILARTHGADPDIIELYYDGPGQLDLSDMSLTDKPSNPRKFVFTSQTVTTTTMGPGSDYMILYGDLTHEPNHLGFALSAEGEGLYLYDKPANGGGLLDSVEFGLQLNNYSIGRVGYGSVWKLTKPTFGSANIAQPLADPDTLKINEWLANEEVLFANDFIELYNPQVLPVDLSGMYLTDNPVTQPGKHQIAPLSFITGGGFAVFIADGDPEDGPNHLDLRLSADREMIGLFDAELNEIDKVLYVAQTTDVSQGRSPDGADSFAYFWLPTPGVTNTMATIPPATFTLVPSGATAQYYVPNNSTWESTWMEPNFSELGAWKSGKTGLGFGFGGMSMAAYNDCVYEIGHPYIGTYVTTYGIGSGYSGATSGPLLDQATGDDIGITATLTQNGGVNWQPSLSTGGYDCDVGTDAHNTFAGIADMTGVIYYGSADWWVDLTFTGLDPTTAYTFATSAARCNYTYTNRLTIYTLNDADTYTNASTSGVDVLAENRVRFNTGDNYNEGYVARWTGITAADGSFTVRAEADTSNPKAYSFDVFKLEGGFSGSDLEGDMLGFNASLWTRIEFDVVEDPGLFNMLKLRMKYEDGFVAYLNGVEVTGDNFTGTPRWNSTADGDRQNDLALQFVDFDISDHISDLQQGHNVLAIHGLNDNVNDPNFLILPELVAASDPGLSIYGKALALLDGLRITELMYHDPDNSDYDFIELQNVGDVPLHLNGVCFTDGIEYIFPAMTLDVDEYVVVVSHLASFSSRYGTAGINIAGEYTGNLSNGGEDVVLTLAWPLDAAILRFEYDDSWYPSTDGFGYSLTIRDPYAHPATWDKAESWQAALPSP